jgi:hypothetical protein
MLPTSYVGKIYTHVPAKILPEQLIRKFQCHAVRILFRQNPHGMPKLLGDRRICLVLGVMAECVIEDLKLVLN